MSRLALAASWLFAAVALAEDTGAVVDGGSPAVDPEPPSLVDPSAGVAGSAATAGGPAPSATGTASEDSLGSSELPVRRLNSLTAQPLPWILGIYSGAYERALSERVSFAVGFNAAVLTVIQQQGDHATSTLVTGGGIQPGVHYYLAGRAPAGLWLGLKAELGHLSLRTTSEADAIGGKTRVSTVLGGFTYGGHAMVGYTHVFETGFTLLGGVGLGGTGFSFSSSSETTSTGTGGGTTGGTSTPTTTSSTPTFLTASFGRVALGAGWSF